MRKSRAFFLVAINIVLIIFLFQPTFSYFPQGREGDQDPRQVTPKQKVSGPKPQRFGENLAILRLLRMTKALDLTEEQAAKIFPLANRIEKEKMDLNRQLNQEIRELRSLLQGHEWEETKLKEKVQKIKNLREAIRLKDKEFESFLEKNLTIGQQAKYILFNIEFAQFLTRNLERIRNLQGQPSPSPVKKTPEK